MTATRKRSVHLTLNLGLLATSLCAWAGAAGLLGTPLVPQESFSDSLEFVLRHPTSALVVCVVSGSVVPLGSALIALGHPAPVAPDAQFSVRLSCVAIGAAATVNAIVGARVILDPPSDHRVASQLVDTLVADRSVAYALLALVLLIIAASTPRDRPPARRRLLPAAAVCAITVPCGLLIDQANTPIVWLAVPSTAACTALALCKPDHRGPMPDT